MEETLYIRLRAVCCSEWGLSPGAFEQEVSAERVAVEDVLEALVLRGYSSMGDLMTYVFREKAIERRSKMEKVKALVVQLQGTQDPEKRAKLAAMINELNKGK